MFEVRFDGYFIIIIIITTTTLEGNLNYDEIMTKESLLKSFYCIRSLAFN